jgi:hypothetical protein
MNRIYTGTGRELTVYDGLFDLHYRQSVYQFAQSSLFQIGWADGAIIENQANRFIHSIYSKEDIERLGIITRILNSPAAGELDGYKFDRAVLNLSTAADANYVHTHGEDKILLYYVNLEWYDGWHGETLFFQESLRDVAFTSVYTPGRLLAFDAKIPHTIRPQSHIAAQYRFTLALIFNRAV